MQCPKCEAPCRVERTDTYKGVGRYRKYYCTKCGYELPSWEEYGPPPLRKDKPSMPPAS